MGSQEAVLITLLVEGPLTSGEELAVVGDRYRHLCRARRVEVGERLRLTGGRGTAAWGEIEAIDRRRATLRVGEAAPSHEPARRVELWAGTLRSSRATWLVEKATELGAHAVRFFASGRSARSYGEAGIARLERVAAAALEQSHRAWLPPVTGVHAWDEVLALGAGLFLDPEADSGPGVTPFTAERGPLVIVVGPEGGWEPRERDELAAAGLLGVGLGERTLRVETAAVAGLAIALTGAA